MLRNCPQRAPFPLAKPTFVASVCCTQDTVSLVSVMSCSDFSTLCSESVSPRMSNTMFKQSLAASSSQRMPCIRSSIRIAFASGVSSWFVFMSSRIFSNAFSFLSSSAIRSSNSTLDFFFFLLLLSLLAGTVCEADSTFTLRLAPPKASQPTLDLVDCRLERESGICKAEFGDVGPNTTPDLGDEAANLDTDSDPFERFVSGGDLMRSEPGGEFWATNVCPSKLSSNTVPGLLLDEPGLAEFFERTCCNPFATGTPSFSE
mmetsp:Transcript_40363/g.69593  ORF Transcript_40363/g.69593 Transcript_40363/m.69593 type:complete len:260 (+) Transcript_40363:650-1429(+)